MSWDYTNVDGENWNDKPLEWQREQLLRYYPIGMEIQFIETDLVIDITTEKGTLIDFCPSNDNLFIIKKHTLEHTGSLSVYNLRIYNGLEILVIHPGFFKPTLKYLRTQKLKRLCH